MADDGGGEPGDAGDPEAVAADLETVGVSVGDRVEGVATVTVSRPDARNALNGQVRAELKAALAAVEGSDVRVVVLTGDDEGKAFAAGADVNELAERDALEQRRASERPRIYEAVADLRQPVVARINGHALGGGCELALACDVRIASTHAKLGQPEINLGIIPGGGGTQRLPRVVGTGQAMRLVLSGELIDAGEAERIGLVEAAVEPDALDDRVYGLAGTMAEKSPVALKFAKEAVKAAAETPLSAGLDREADLFAALFATEDKAEGMAAFFEDREPEWTGR
jgi:enoyl-CoA hydratase